MQKYVRKHESVESVVVEAAQFMTNNEADNAQMNAIVEWSQQKRTKARHDGTCIYLLYHAGKEARASVGDWIVSRPDGILYVVASHLFGEMFELCGHDWEAVDDSDYDQCLVCGDTRPFEMQYFGDEVL